MKRGVALLSTILALTSCRTMNPLIELEKEIIPTELLEEKEPIIEDSPEVKRMKHWDALSKYTPLTPENKFNPDGTEKAPFNWIDDGLEEHIKKIYILKKEDFFHEYDWMAAHAHSELGIICLPEDYNKQLVVHEAAHVKQAHIKFTTRFLQDWEKAAKIEYGSLIDVTDDDVFWKDETFGPKQGHMEAYSNKSLSEDVATFVEFLGYDKDSLEVQILIEVDEELEKYVRKYPLYFCDKNDSRYKEKIDLLYMYDFIDYSEYLEMYENLGCLRHLWKN